MQIVQLDLWEDLPPINGFRHILLIHCLFSKLTLGIPKKSKTGREIVLNLKNVIQILGPPALFNTDNAPAFRSSEMLEFCALFDISLVWTTVRSSKSRGAVENSIRILSNVMRKYLVQGKRLTWPDLVHFCIIVLNNTKREVTGNKSPYEILSGYKYKPRGLEDISIPYESKTRIGSTQKLIETLGKEREEIRKLVRAELQKTDAARLISYNKNAIKEKFPVGTLCVRKLYRTGVNVRLRERFAIDLYLVVESFDDANHVVAMRLSDLALLRLSIRDLKVVKLIPEDLDLLPVEVRNYLFTGVKKGEMDSEELLQIINKHSEFLLPSDTSDLIGMDVIPSKLSTKEKLEIAKSDDLPEEKPVPIVEVEPEEIEEISSDSDSESDSEPKQDSSTNYRKKLRKNLPRVSFKGM